MAGGRALNSEKTPLGGLPLRVCCLQGWGLSLVLCQLLFSSRVPHPRLAFTPARSGRAATFFQFSLQLLLTTSYRYDIL
jgi:hypothetical protein